MNAPTTTPLEAVIEGDAKIRLGDQAVTAIRQEQIAELYKARQELTVAFDELGSLNEPTARGELEALGGALDRCRRAADALWYLAHDDAEAAGAEA